MSGSIKQSVILTQWKTSGTAKALRTVCVCVIIYEHQGSCREQLLSYHRSKGIPRHVNGKRAGARVGGTRWGLGWGGFRALMFSFNSVARQHPNSALSQTRGNRRRACDEAFLMEAHGDSSSLLNKEAQPKAISLPPPPL